MAKSQQVGNDACLSLVAFVRFEEASYDLHTDHALFKRRKIILCGLQVVEQPFGWSRGLSRLFFIFGFLLRMRSSALMSDEL
jgi:hypothetical protein